MLITPTNQTIIFIHNFNFDKKSNSRNLTKMTKLLWNNKTKKNLKTNLIFLNENRNQKSNLKNFI